MKILASALNIALFGWACFMLTDKGFPSFDDSEFLLVVLFIFSPLFALIALYLPNVDSWASLYVKRKMLEEKKKIEALGAK